MDKICNLKGTQTRARIEKTHRKTRNIVDKALRTRQDGRKTKMEGRNQATTEKERKGRTQMATSIKRTKMKRGRRRRKSVKKVEIEDAERNGMQRKCEHRESSPMSKVLDR